MDLHGGGYAGVMYLNAPHLVFPNKVSPLPMNHGRIVKRGEDQHVRIDENRRRSVLPVDALAAHAPERKNGQVSWEALRPRLEGCYFLRTSERPGGVGLRRCRCLVFQNVLDGVVERRSVSTSGLAGENGGAFVQG